MVPPIGTSLLAGPTVPCTAMLELVPSSLEPTPLGTTPLTAPRATTLTSTLTRRVTPAVPLGFLPHVASVTSAAPRAVLAAHATSCAAPMTPATS
jgi:hypothetical protein